MTNANSMDRRTFLMMTAATASMATVALTTRNAQASTPASTAENPRVHRTAKRVLVAYATRNGSTVEVAQTIGNVLQAQGATVDVQPVSPSLNPAGYDAVVVGSAVRMGGWLKEAVEWVQRNKVPLGSVPTAFFCVHILATDDSTESRQQRSAYLDKPRTVVKPISEAFFAGKIDQAKLPMFDRMMTRMVKSPTGDYRNWDLIRNWAHAISPTLLPA